MTKKLKEEGPNQSILYIQTRNVKLKTKLFFKKRKNDQNSKIKTKKIEFEMSITRRTIMLF